MIYILLPVHSRRAITEEFVACLERQEDQGFHLVLIDDGSSDGTADAVLARLPSATVLRGSGTWWWAGSLQHGYSWLKWRRPGRRDLVLIGNDDTRFEPEFLARGRAAVAAVPHGLLLARLHEPGSADPVEVGVHADWSKLTFEGVLDPSRVNCLSTRGLFLRATDFLALGGFRPRILPHYLSDYEFTIRAGRRGYQLVSDAGVRLWYEPTATGIRTAATGSPRAYLRSTLSRRSALNPVFWTTFVLLCSPMRYLPRNLYRVWHTFLVGLRASRHGPGS